MNVSTKFWFCFGVLLIVGSLLNVVRADDDEDTVAEKVAKQPKTFFIDGGEHTTEEEMRAIVQERIKQYSGPEAAFVGHFGPAENIVKNIMKDIAADTPKPKPTKSKPTKKVQGDQPGGDDDDDDGEEEEREMTPTLVEENGVLVLTDDNFDDVVAKRDILLVEFYAPWCGHCKSLKPVYAEAAEELKKSDPPVALGMVDATVHTSLAQTHSVSGYPTLKFHKKGTWYDYDGPRDKEGIVNYMKERADPNWKPPPAAVVDLTKDTFDEFINADLSLVEFYAPWCGHCKQLAPKYEKAAQKLKENDPPIPLGKVDATVETDLGSKYAVQGYPTMKLFRKGKAFEFKGGRDEYSIVDYMLKQVGDASSEVKTVKELKSKAPVDDILVVGFFKDKSPLYEAFQDAASDLRDDIQFVHTFSDAVMKSYKVKPESIVVLVAERFHTKLEDTMHVLDKADSKMDDIIKFTRDHQIPLVGELTTDNQEKRYKSRPLCLMFYTVDFSIAHRDATQLWRKKFARIAKDYPMLKFAVADEEKQSQFFKDFKFDESGEEINIGCLDEKNRKFPMEPMSEYDSDEIRQFLDSYEKGDAKAIVKSQLIPKKQKGPVVTVVGKTFEKIVLDKSKDVLIEFYAPWCGHCKTFEPKYKNLAKRFVPEKNLVIAKMDATANDAAPEFEVKGFPTIYLSPANSDKPIQYEGDRDEEDLIKFIKKHATASFTDDKTKDEL